MSASCSAAAAHLLLEVLQAVASSPQDGLQGGGLREVPQRPVAVHGGGDGCSTRPRTTRSRSGRYREVAALGNAPQAHTCTNRANEGSGKQGEVAQSTEGRRKAVGVTVRQEACTIPLSAE